MKALVENNEDTVVVNWSTVTDKVVDDPETSTDPK